MYCSRFFNTFSRYETSDFSNSKSPVNIEVCNYWTSELTVKQNLPKYTVNANTLVGKIILTGTFRRYGLNSHNMYINRFSFCSCPLDRLPNDLQVTSRKFKMFEKA